MEGGSSYADTGDIQDDLRQQVSDVILERAELLVWDTVAIFPFSGTEHLEPAYCTRIGQLLVQLLALGVREGKVDSRSGMVADLHRIALERSLPVERLFTFVYLLERTVLDELALSDRIGATSEPWPLAAQLVRRASFDLLAGYTARAQLDPSDAAITDRLTTLYTRPMFDAVLAKELERAGRFGYPVSLILFDVDHLSAINKEHGYGVGDKVLERLGLLIRQYFRQHDWVARYAEDAMAVFHRTDAEHANALAERVRPRSRSASVHRSPIGSPGPGHGERRGHQPEDRPRRRHRHRTPDGGRRVGRRAAKDETQPGRTRRHLSGLAAQQPHVPASNA
jgi:diguanylate cyclase (GGDEF)-like protein